LGLPFARRKILRETNLENAPNGPVERDRFSERRGGASFRRKRARPCVYFNRFFRFSKGAAANGAAFLRSFFADYAGFNGALAEGRENEARRFKSTAPVKTFLTTMLTRKRRILGCFNGFNGWRRLQIRRRRERNGR
jgi:hypothetical protein